MNFIILICLFIGGMALLGFALQFIIIFFVMLVEIPKSIISSIKRKKELK